MKQFQETSFDAIHYIKIVQRSASHIWFNTEEKCSSTCYSFLSMTFLFLSFFVAPSPNKRRCYKKKERIFFFFLVLVLGCFLVYFCVAGCFVWWRNSLPLMWINSLRTTVILHREKYWDVEAIKLFQYTEMEWPRIWFAHIHIHSEELLQLITTHFELLFLIVPVLMQ